MKKLYIILIIVVVAAAVVGAGAWYFWRGQKAPISGFDDCVKAGYPVLETYPEQCKTPDGRSFTNSNQGAGIANPASVFCENNGGTLDIRQDANGGQVGYCVFKDKTECEEWAYFRKECSPGEQKTSGISGTVTLSPTCPVEHIPPEPQCAPKPYATTIEIMKAGNATILKTVQSDENGTFQVELEPGTYELQAKGGATLPRCLNVSVEVKAEQYSSAEISCDTGIR